MSCWGAVVLNAKSLNNKKEFPDKGERAKALLERKEMEEKMKLSILITLFNEELVSFRHMKPCRHNWNRCWGRNSDWRTLYIDDGSSDQTYELITAIAKENPRKYIRFSRNFGRESGILAGFKYASGDAVMVMDGDLQHPPYLIPFRGL